MEYIFKRFNCRSGCAGYQQKMATMGTKHINSQEAFFVGFSFDLIWLQLHHICRNILSSITPISLHRIKQDRRSHRGCHSRWVPAMFTSLVSRQSARNLVLWPRMNISSQVSNMCARCRTDFISGKLFEMTEIVLTQLHILYAHWRKVDFCTISH